MTLLILAIVTAGVCSLSAIIATGLQRRDTPMLSFTNTLLLGASLGLLPGGGFFIAYGQLLYLPAGVALGMIFWVMLTFLIVKPRRP